MPKVIKEEDNIKRQEIINTILNILGKKDGETQIIFFLNKIDEDEELQNKIYELEEDIKKYYKAGSWTCFSKDESIIKRKWLSMTKYLCKEHNINISSYRKKMKDEETEKQKDFTIYTIKKL
jgi:hypothetical protein